MSSQSLKIRKRNIWTMDEVRYFLSLIEEKQILGLMDGKRIRVSDIFKTLIAPMKERGYIRDVSQLTIKYKNLKADYYKCKRHNAVSGNDYIQCDFYVELDNLLGSRPLSQVESDHSMGFENLSELQVVDENDPDIINRMQSDVTIEMYEDAPDVDGAIPGCSNYSDASTAKGTSLDTVSPTTRKTTETLIKKKKDSKKTQQLFLEELNSNRKEDAERDRELFDRLSDRSEQMMLNCMKMFLSGLERILKSPEKKSKNDVSSDED